MMAKVCRLRLSPALPTSRGIEVSIPPRSRGVGLITNATLRSIPDRRLPDRQHRLTLELRLSLTPAAGVEGDQGLVAWTLVYPTQRHPRAGWAMERVRFSGQRVATVTG
jgi:hypothetical protein